MCSKKGVVNVLNDCSKQTGPSASRGNDISRLPFLQKPFLQKRGPLSFGNLFLVKGKRPPPSATTSTTSMTTTSTTVTTTTTYDTTAQVDDADGVWSEDDCAKVLFCNFGQSRSIQFCTFLPLQPCSNSSLSLSHLKV